MSGRVGDTIGPVLLSTGACVVCSVWCQVGWETLQDQFCCLLERVWCVVSGRVGDTTGPVLLSTGACVVCGVRSGGRHYRTSSAVYWSVCSVWCVVSGRVGDITGPVLLSTGACVVCGVRSAGRHYRTSSAVYWSVCGVWCQVGWETLQDQFCCLLERVWCVVSGRMGDSTGPVLLSTGACVVCGVRSGGRLYRTSSAVYWSVCGVWCQVGWETLQDQFCCLLERVWCVVSGRVGDTTGPVLLSTGACVVCGVRSDGRLYRTSSAVYWSVCGVWCQVGWETLQDQFCCLLERVWCVVSGRVGDSTGPVLLSTGACVVCGVRSGGRHYRTSSAVYWSVCGVWCVVCGRLYRTSSAVYWSVCGVWCQVGWETLQDQFCCLLERVLCVVSGRVGDTTGPVLLSTGACVVCGVRSAGRLQDQFCCLLDRVWCVVSGRVGDSTGPVLLSTGACVVCGVRLGGRLYRTSSALYWSVCGVWCQVGWETL